eukprot:366532-Chlamydomonas_euryale.AAC.10
MKAREAASCDACTLRARAKQQPHGRCTDDSTEASHFTAPRVAHTSEQRLSVQHVGKYVHRLVSQREASER